MKHTIRYVGDIHGRNAHFAIHDEKARDDGIRYIVQCGDLGVMYAPSRKDADSWRRFRDIEGRVPPDNIAKRLMRTRAQEGSGPWPVWITVGGNHDNWPAWRRVPTPRDGDGMRELAPGLFFADRNTIVRIEGVEHLFFGGARSTDAWRRVPGLSWWEEELPTKPEVELFFDRMSERSPPVVVTHDCTVDATPEGTRSIRNNNRLDDPLAKELGKVLEACGHRPLLWAFGHHHAVSRETDEHGTEWLCCGWKRDYVDVTYQIEDSVPPSVVNIETHQLDKPDLPMAPRPRKRR